MRSRLTTLLTVVGLSMALGVVGAPAAQADVPCAIEGFSPRTVVVGRTPVVGTFAVSTSGCSMQSWSVDGGIFYVYPDARQWAFNPYSNSLAGPRDVIVEVGGGDGTEVSRAFADGFSLLRRTTWQDKSFNAAPEPARRGSAITIAGRLLVADWSHGRYIP
jgi:hypothetical protein